MLRRIPTLLLCFFFALSLTACDSNGDDGDDDGNGGEVPSSGVQATIDGEDFAATVVALANRDNDGSITITGSNLSTTIGVDIEEGATGTYQMGAGNGTTGSVTRVSDGTPQTFTTAIGGGGSATITSISETEVEGTFSFTANSANSSGSVDVVGGFNVNIVQE